MQESEDGKLRHETYTSERRGATKPDAHCMCKGRLFFRIGVHDRRMATKVLRAQYPCSRYAGTRQASKKAPIFRMRV